MNALLLHPTDTLFFRDGRPMSGSLSGHGAAWPLPTVVNAALHAAMHRADLEKVHGHDQIRMTNGLRKRLTEDSRKFGSLVSAGPFPVDPAGQWLFPCPADAQGKDSTRVTFLPAGIAGGGSLPGPLTYPAASLQPPTKDKPASWWSRKAWSVYLQNGELQAPGKAELPVPADFLADADFLDTEHSIGIGISPETGIQDGERFYSAHSLRLRNGWSLGTLAEAMDKVGGDPARKRDLVEVLFPNTGARAPVIVGGQQRLCGVERHHMKFLPFPEGLRHDFRVHEDKHLLKWVLLTPAIFPAITQDTARGIQAQPGGWLPNWIASKKQDFEGNGVEAGSVLLLDGPGKDKSRRKKLSPGHRVHARLVAAITGKPLPVTGYALPNDADETRLHGGAKSTHFAVPAGSVYYFECEGATAAKSLAAALNWHGDGDSTAIRRRRSTLMGEKGFGLGVCGTWAFHLAPTKPRD